MMSVTGWPDSAPTRTGTAIGDVLGGLNCCIGILAALQGRTKTGRGERIDIGLVDCSVSAMETINEIYMVEGRVPKRSGNRYEFIYPYDSFEVADGWIVIAVGNDHLWEGFCKAIKHEDWFADARFKTNPDRVKHNIVLNEMVTAWTRLHSGKEVIDILRANNIPCSRIYSIPDVVTDEHIAKAREMIVEIDHPLEGKMKITGNPIKFAESDKFTYEVAPVLGRDTRDILEKELRLKKEEIAYFIK